MHFVLILIVIAYFLNKYVLKPLNEAQQSKLPPQKKPIEYFVNGELINDSFDNYYLDLLNLTEEEVYDMKTLKTKVNRNEVFQLYATGTPIEEYINLNLEQIATTQFLIDRINYMHSLN